MEDQTSKSPSLEEIKPVMRPDTDEQTQQQVISWADEVDKEFPLESSKHEMELEDISEGELEVCKFLLPYKQRPATSTATARSMIQFTSRTG